MNQKFSTELKDRYKKHMFKKYGVVISDSQTESDLDSLGSFCISFCIAEQTQKAKPRVKSAEQALHEVAFCDDSLGEKRYAEEGR